MVFLIRHPGSRGGGFNVRSRSSGRAQIKLGRREKVALRPLRPFSPSSFVATVGSTSSLFTAAGSVPEHLEAFQAIRDASPRSPRLGILPRHHSLKCSSGGFAQIALNANTPSLTTAVGVQVSRLSESLQFNSGRTFVAALICECGV